MRAYFFYLFDIMIPCISVQFTRSNVTTTNKWYAAATRKRSRKNRRYENYNFSSTYCKTKKNAIIDFLTRVIPSPSQLENWEFYGYDQKRDVSTFQFVKRSFTFQRLTNRNADIFQSSPRIERKLLEHFHLVIKLQVKRSINFVTLCD